MSKKLSEMTQEEFEAEIARGHAKRYPNGCREEGHHCFPCLARLGQEPHPFASRKIGARPFYKGTWEHRCLIPGCKAV